MNSIEALENIAITFDEGGYEPTTLGAKSGSFKEVFGIEFNIIEQDLKCLRQKQLEEKNKELKEKINKLNKELVIEREVGGMTSKESLRNLKQEILTPNYLTDYEKDECIDVIQQELERLKKLEEAIEILKDKFNLKVQALHLLNSEIQYELQLREHCTTYCFSIPKDIYELLKEVLGK